MTKESVVSDNSAGKAGTLECVCKGNRNKNEESEVMYDDEKSGNEKIGDCSQHDYLGSNSERIKT